MNTNPGRKRPLFVNPYINQLSHRIALFLTFTFFRITIAAGNQQTFNSYQYRRKLYWTPLFSKYQSVSMTNELKCAIFIA